MSSPADPIVFYNRYTNETLTEKVYGESYLRWIYQSALGKACLHTLVKRKAFSSWYGYRMNRSSSAKKIVPFIEQYGVEEEEFLSPAVSFKNFNEFFYRKLQSSARPICKAPQIAFPADGRHLVFPDISAIDGVFVKGQQFSLESFLPQRNSWINQFRRGSMVISRLCPVDYHRFHFPLEGTVASPVEIDGHLFSVSPIALREKLAYFWQNKRVIIPLRTEAMGTVLVVPVGATCVGSIHLTASPESFVTQGQELGYFSFGGSTVITIFPPDAVTFDEDLLENSAKQIETYARMGDHLGVVNAIQ